MKQHFIPRDPTVAELERKAADAEEQSAKQPEPRATELLEWKRQNCIENGPLLCGLGCGRLERIDKCNGLFTLHQSL
jgi:hypothetical protein